MQIQADLYFRVSYCWPNPLGLSPDWMGNASWMNSISLSHFVHFWTRTLWPSLSRLRIGPYGPTWSLWSRKYSWMAFAA